MSILIIGKNGQIGYELARACDAAGLDYHAVGRDEIDLSSSDSIMNFFKTNNMYKYIINAAGYTKVDQAEDEPELANKINHLAVRELALICKKHDITLIHFSTDYVFDGKKKTLYNEEDIINPLGVYGDTKLKGENAIREILAKYIILRVSWVFGAHGNNFVKTMAKFAMTKSEISVVADQYGCPTAARDIARVILEILPKLESHNYGLYHYCSYPLSTWHQLAVGEINVIKDKSKNKKIANIKAIETKDYPTKAIRPKNSGLDTAKITKTFGIKQNNWSDYLLEVINACDLEGDKK